MLAPMLLCAAAGYGQGLGLEGIIVEKYYISDANDATDTDGGFLPEGSTTYRIYVDLATGYKLETVFGNADNELRIATTTFFFNNEDRGKITGSELQNNRLDDNTVALDSYLAIAGASNAHFGVLKSEDPNGSIVGGPNNDGGSAGIAAGLLANNDPEAGIPLTTSDGLIPGSVPNITLIADDSNIWSIFDNENAGPVFSTNNGAWAVLGGFTGPTPENKILIAQITTDGELSFKLNIRINLINGGGIEDYVSGIATGNQIFYPSLIFPEPAIEGCTDPLSCNYNPDATIDDGSCLTPVDNCLACNETNDGLVLIDDDGDGVCNADEVPGCTDPEALNYNPNATDDDGSCQFQGIPGCTSPTACNFNPDATVENFSCLEPVENCLTCNDTNDALILIDTDGDGICDADEVAGCQSPSACNYNPLATDDDGSCIEPVEDCLACNENNDGLVIIDSDGDGICDADEIAGCQSTSACNYNPEATDDNGSCLEPIENCLACNESNDGLILIDDDGDGVCNADEIPGCTIPEAVNYNPEATDDDGSCQFLSVNDANTKHIHIYPNPFDEEFNVVLSSNEAAISASTYRLIDVLGTLITAGNFSSLRNNKGSYTIRMDVVAQGTYLFILEHPEFGMITKRVVKQ